MKNLIVYLLYSSTFLSFIYADVKFPKNFDVNHKFPPVITRLPHTKHPDGHMRPFGYQRRPEGKAREFQQFLTPTEFYKDCVKPGIPCVFKGVFNGSAPMAKWSDQYLEANFGSKNVTIEKYFADKTKEKYQGTMKHFLRNYHHKEIFLRQTILKEMEKDVPISRMLLCGTIRSSLTEVVVWMSSGFSPSRLHYDSESQLHCIVNGRKDLVLYQPKHAHIFNMIESFPGSASASCPWDPEIISLYRNPLLARTPWTWATLWPGDCLYLPAGYLHQVRAYGERSISLATHWIHQNKTELFDCEDSIGAADLTAGEVDLFWTFEEGDRRIREDVISPESLRHHLYLLAGRSSTNPANSLTYTQFYHFFLEANENYVKFLSEGIVDDITEFVHPKTVFEYIDVEKKGFITREQIKDASEEIFEEIARLVTPPHVHSEHDEL